MENILVTGAAGFIGSKLVAELIKQQHKVYALIEKGDSMSREKLHAIDSNIKIIDNREKSDIIWIIYEEGIQEEVTKLINKYNFKSSFERRGSIVTNNKAALRVMCK